jgi:hypothetical protein
LRHWKQGCRGQGIGLGQFIKKMNQGLLVLCGTVTCGYAYFSFLVKYDDVMRTYRRDEREIEKLETAKQRALCIEEKVKNLPIRCNVAALGQLLENIGYERSRIAVEQILLNIDEYERHVKRCKERNWIVRFFEPYEFDHYCTYWDTVINRTHDITRRKFKEAHLDHITAHEVSCLLNYASYELKN